MKISAAAITALSLVGVSEAYSVSRSDIRNLGQKSVSVSPSRSVGAATSGASSMKMEDFGLLKGSGIGFEDLWGGEEVISEAALEKRLNKDGLRFRMNRTAKEADEVGRLEGFPGVTLNLPIIGETYLGPPKVASVWEAMGFTATSNNDARQAEKKKAVEKARDDTKTAIQGSIWPVAPPPSAGKSLRADWLEKYGYPRLVGSGGIFYADQLSTDKEPSGGFNMGKSGSIWPVPKVVEEGQYGGSMGWGMKKKGPAIDGLEKQPL